MSRLWTSLASAKNSLCPLVSSFVKIMSLLKTSKSPVDPSHFLRHLQKLMSNSGENDFDIFQQQDVAEVVGSLLEEFCISSALVKSQIQISVHTSITCNRCCQTNLKEETSLILQLAADKSIQSAINSFLRPEELSEGNLYFCELCNSYEGASLEHHFSSVGSYLIVQLKRFLNDRDRLFKDIQLVECVSLLSLPIVDANVTAHKKFKLIGTINHTGTLQRGHYTSFIRPSGVQSWLHCNDAAVLGTKEAKVNSTTSYLFFYEAV